MNEDRIMELLSELVEGQKQLEANISNIKTDMSNVKTDMSNVKIELSEVKEDIQFTRQTVARIEIEHGQMLKALFDGDYMNREKVVNFIEPHIKEIDKKIEHLELDVTYLKNAK